MPSALAFLRHLRAALPARGGALGRGPTAMGWAEGEDAAAKERRRRRTEPKGLKKP